jgi:hypothetical protein
VTWKHGACADARTQILRLLEIYSRSTSLTTLLEAKVLHPNRFDSSSCLETKQQHPINLTIALGFLGAYMYAARSFEASFEKDFRTGLPNAVCRLIKMER